MSNQFLIWHFNNSNCRTVGGSLHGVSLGFQLFQRTVPVCVLRCLCSSSLRVNLLPHNIQLHTKGLSPECQRRCARRWEVFPYTFPQPAMWQMCCFFFPVLDPL